MRLQKYIAECGIVSRRKAEEFIKQGRVKVNGEVVTQLGTKIDPKEDKVFVNGKLASLRKKKLYLKIYKPRGVFSSCYHRGEKTIVDFVRDLPYRLYPVGRLDKDSEGLMILTNDGALANKLMHPRYEHEKEYEVEVEKPISQRLIKRFEYGVEVDGKKTMSAKIKCVGLKKFFVTLKEGRKRQIRQTVREARNRIVRLKRIRIQNIELGDLKPGEFEYISSKDLNILV